MLDHDLDRSQSASGLKAMTALSSGRKRVEPYEGGTMRAGCGWEPVSSESAASPFNFGEKPRRMLFGKQSNKLRKLSNESTDHLHIYQQVLAASQNASQTEFKPSFGGLTNTAQPNQRYRDVVSALRRYIDLPVSDHDVGDDLRLPFASHRIGFFTKPSALGKTAVYEPILPTLSSESLTEQWLALRDPDFSVNELAEPALRQANVRLEDILQNTLATLARRFQKTNIRVYVLWDEQAKVPDPVAQTFALTLGLPSKSSRDLLGSAFAALFETLRLSAQAARWPWGMVSVERKELVMQVEAVRPLVRRVAGYKGESRPAALIE